jgi:hypothetical protein
MTKTYTLTLMDDSGEILNVVQSPVLPRFAHVIHHSPEAGTLVMSDEPEVEVPDATAIVVTFARIASAVHVAADEGVQEERSALFVRVRA